ncbi:MAG: nitrous oxide reductase accessory protein NosL [Planctomycetales bacterium]|nr:nitrous oxide reductase accessory protein NosL [bacterium]UNM07796.1 MAG: nitrous oxide reductase accessory protein NosL [Planctomycetales bacterium]
MYKYLIAMLAMVIFATAAWAQKDDEPIRCDTCGMFCEKSSTRMQMELNIDGEKGLYHFESLGCVFNKMAELKEGGAKEIKVANAMILDYSTFGTDDEQMLDPHEAWYLVGTSRLKGSMAPFIAAFATKDMATSMQDELGGEVMDHDSMAAQMVGDDEDRKHDGHDDGSKEMHAMADVYICPCSGGCCDDIKSDKPGECPKCGMQLVKKEDK